MKGDTTITVKACWSVPEDVVDHWLIQVQILKALHITDELCSPCTTDGGQHNAIGGRLVSKSLVSHPLPQFSISISNQYGSVVREQILMCSCVVA